MSMMRAVSTACLGILCVLSGGCASTVCSSEPLTFAAMGDGPREDNEWAMFEEQIAQEGRDGRSAFMVHVGDIWKGAEFLPEAHYARVAACLRKCDVPVVVVPGDNEWNDLDDPDTGMVYWQRHFVGIEKQFADPLDTRRQSLRPENVAWVSSGVLMIGLNLVGGEVHDAAEWELRHRQNVDWVRACFSGLGRNARAAVVFAQAAPSGKQKDFFDPFVEDAASFAKPVLYLHGDGHVFEVEEAWRVPNLTRVQVDQVKKAPPLLVTVDPTSECVFTFARRLPDRQDGP